MAKRDRLLQKSDDYWQEEPELFAAGYERSANPIQAALHAFLNQRSNRAYKYLALKTGQDVAEVGCGSGEQVRDLARVAGRIYGLDYSEGMLELARKNNPGDRVEFIHTDCAPIPLPENVVDAALCLGVLDYVPQPAAFLAEIGRIVRPGGRIVFTTPKRPSLFAAMRWSALIRRKVFGQPPVLNCLKEAELLALIDQVGLEVVDLSDLWTTMWMVGARVKG